jgi:hypothetical protein
MMLAACAVGLAEIDRRLRSVWGLPPFTVTAATVLALVGFGPLFTWDHPAARTYLWPNSWTNHGLYQYDYSLGAQRRWGENQVPVTPPFYSKHLRRAAPDTLVLEAPWWFAQSPFPYYQRIHRHRMMVGLAAPMNPDQPGGLPWPDERFHFRNFVHLADIAGLRERSVDAVILHRDLAREFRTGKAEQLPSMEPWIELYERELGPPTFEDEYVVVFEVR